MEGNVEMSTFGKKIEISLFGESHGQAIGMTIHNFPANITLDLEHIRHQLALRRGLPEISTSRREADAFSIISGYFQNKTTGAPLTFLIPNEDVESRPYEQDPYTVRPGHADVTQYLKYAGANDYRGGGHLSGRITAPLVILGAICAQRLSEKGIAVSSRIKSIAGITDTLVPSWTTFEGDPFPVSDPNMKQKMLEAINQARSEGDSVGCIVETCVTGLDSGLGEPFFDSVESIISHLIFSIPAVKGIEFGDGFDFSKMRGSQANDSPSYENGKLVFLTNHNGGILGGITSGAPLLFRTAIKPTPSIAKVKDTINIVKQEKTTINIRGRHDPCIVPRALHVINALTAYALFELYERNQ
jgi:chorismate synthase